MNKKVDNLKAPHRSTYLRKWTMMELVELSEDQADYEENDGEVVITRKKRKGKKKPQKGRLEKVKRPHESSTYTIEEKETGDRSTGWTHKKMQMFVHSLKKSELSKFRIIKEEKEELVSEAVIVNEKQAQVQDHRKGSFAETQQKREESQSTSLDVACECSPELDTVRIYFDCRSLIYLDLFIPFTATKKVYLATKGLTGYIDKEATHYRTEMKCSWYGKMQITREEKKWGKNAKYSYPVLCFEYSVAKWYNFTNGINSGLAPTAELLLIPCIQAMKALKIERFAYDNINFDRIATEFLQTAELRRFDLSLNFKCPTIYKPVDYIKICSRCRFNLQDSVWHDDGSYSWGKEKSPYRIIVYDKETEQREYYNRKEPGGRCVYFTDDQGNTYECQNAERNLKEVTVDHNHEKMTFYQTNKYMFENVYRFEVQFRSRFIQEQKLMAQGVENIDNVIKVGVVYWRDLLNRMDEQLGRENFNTTDEKDGFAHVLDKLQNMKSSGTISRTIYSNMFTFLMETAYKPWTSVRDEMGADLFSRRYRWTIKNLNYDIKVARSKESSIMRIMPTIMLEASANIMRNFRLVPAPVYRPAI